MKTKRLPAVLILFALLSSCSLGMDVIKHSKELLLLFQMENRQEISLFAPFTDSMTEEEFLTFCRSLDPFYSDSVRFKILSNDSEQSVVQVIPGRGRQGSLILQYRRDKQDRLILFDDIQLEQSFDFIPGEK